MKETRIHFFDVGQGDSILIEFESGEIGVIDCYIPPNSADGVPPVFRHLESLAEARNSYDIDFLCLTHPDRDHYHGMSYLLDQVKERGGQVKNLALFAPVPHELAAKVEFAVREQASVPAPAGARIPPRLGRLLVANEEFVQLYKKLGQIRTGIKKWKGQFRRANGFGHFKDFGNSKVYIFGPTSETVEKYSQNYWDDVISEWILADPRGRTSSNELSCILWIIIGKTKILLSGDTTSTSWKAAIDEYNLHHRVEFGHSLNCRVVKAAHHGAKSGSSLEIWRQILDRESSVVISSGYNSGYGHPHIETLEHLRKTGFAPELFCTNICPHYAKGFGEKNFTISEISHLEEESEAPGDPAFSNTQKYNGTCVFEIPEDGVVKVITERTPNTKCSVHEDFDNERRLLT